MYKPFKYESFLKSLSSFRKDAGFTQKQVEKELGLRSLTIYDYESGRLKVPLEELIGLANLYKVEIEDFLGIAKTDDHNEISISKIVPLTRVGFVGTKYKGLYDLIFNDPVIQVELDIREPKHGEFLLDLFVDNLTQKQKYNFLVELLKYINCLIGIDKRITPSELALRDILINSLNIELKEKDIVSIKKAVNNEYLGSVIAPAFPRESYKHFLTWILFWVALADNYYHPKEAEYIEKVAENLGLSKKHFHFIEKLVLEEFKKPSNKEQT